MSFKFSFSLRFYGPMVGAGRESTRAGNMLQALSTSDDPTQIPPEEASPPFPLNWLHILSLLEEFLKQTNQSRDKNKSLIMGPGDQGGNAGRGDHTHFYCLHYMGEEQALGSIGRPGS